MSMSFPDVVRSYWQQTMGIHVQDTADALPVVDAP
jgi:hypothetical protein